MKQPPRDAIPTPRLPQRWITLASCAAFYSGWFAAAEAARRGQPVWSSAYLALLIFAHAWLRRASARELAWYLLTGACGAVLDVALIHGGVFTLPDNPGDLQLFLWLTGLWALMAATFTGCLAWMRERPLIATAFGAIGGPLSYAAAQRYGALRLTDPPTWSMWVFAVEWGCATPLLAVLSKRFAPLPKLEKPDANPPNVA